MTMPFLSGEDIVVFDLDDTLYKEIDYLISAYRSIAQRLELDVVDEMLEWYRSGMNAFQCLIDKYNVSLSLSELLDIYRYHVPVITLSSDASLLLSQLRTNGVMVGIITDGRSKTQRNKLKALGLDWIKDIIVSEEFGSEKPCAKNYLYFEKKYPGYRYSYIADNPKKDFIAPNSLGWMSICLKDDGRNIHHQDFDLSEDLLPQIIVESLIDLI